MSVPSVDYGHIGRIVRDVGQQIVDNMEREIGAVNATIGQTRSDLQLTRDELRKLAAEFNEFVGVAERTARVQRSETKVGTLKDELDREFGHYDVVRRTSIGMLQAFDVGNVSQSMLRNVSEELMLQTPRYWLAPALVGLAAWSTDNPDIAKKSVGEAFSRDPSKTSLFFSLVLRRQKRMDSSVRWLRHYLSSLDPSALGREFAVVLESASHNAFGREGQRVVTERMATWVAELRLRGDVVDEQVAMWRKEITTLGLAVDAKQYEALAKISPDWPTIKQTLEQASSLPQTLEKYTAVKNSETVVPPRLEDLLDDILDTLVTEYDEEELPLRREVRFHEAVIEEDGDLDRARTLADVYHKALETTTDVVSLQTTSAITPQLLGVSQQTQRIAVGVGREDFRTAVGQHSQAYRQAHLSGARLVLGKQHSNYAGQFGFPGWSGRTDQPEADSVQAITRTWDSRFDALSAELAFDTKTYLKPGLIALVVTIVAFLINPGLGLLALAAGGGVVYWIGDQARKKSAAAEAALRANRDPAVKFSVALLRDANAQFVDAQLLFEELDESEVELLSLLDTWPTVGDAEGRVA